MRLESVDALREALGGRSPARVAIVGNARSQFGRGLGPEIDTHDIVVRLNYGKITSPSDQGSRTDVLGCSDPKITLSMIREMFNPGLVIWLTSKAPIQEFFDDDDMPVHVNLLKTWEAAAAYVQPYRPSSGALAAYLFREALGFGHVTLYGFDFFASPTFYHRHSFRFWRKKRSLAHSGLMEKEMMSRLGVAVR